MIEEEGVLRRSFILKGSSIYMPPLVSRYLPTASAIPAIARALLSALLVTTVLAGSMCWHVPADTQQTPVATLVDQLTVGHLLAFCWECDVPWSTILRATSSRDLRSDLPLMPEVAHPFPAERFLSVLLGTPLSLFGQHTRLQI